MREVANVVGLVVILSLFAFTTWNDLWQTYRPQPVAGEPRR
jgi:hypothetical protein